MELKPTDAVLTTYTAERIKVLGCADVDVQYGSQRKKLRVYVVQGNRSCLLGRDWLKAINWIGITLLQFSEKGKIWLTNSVRITRWCLMVNWVL